MHKRVAVSLIAALIGLVSVGAVIAAQPGPSYLAVDSFIASDANENRVKLSATTHDAIPRRPDSFISNAANLVVGIAWVDLGTARAFVTTIHPVIGRDSHQNPDAWHAHTVQLAGGASSPNDFCLAGITSTPTAGIQIQDSQMRVNVAADDLPFAAGAIDAAVGFTVHPDSGCTASRLAVRIRT